MNTKWISLIVTMGVMVGSASIGVGPIHAQDGQLYTACNLWYEHPERMWSTGYQKGAMLPAGTPVKDVTIQKKWTKQYIMFVNADTGVQHGMLFIPSHHPGVSIEQIMDRLFTPKSFDELTSGLTAAEKKGIKDGVVEIGMSKAAVLVAYGYPPETGTSSLESDVWKYWYDRFRTKGVSFKDDKVVSMQ